MKHFSKELDYLLKCTECPLHKTRRNVVIGRGCIPAQILFIGDTPRKSEDLLGEAVFGPAKMLLDTMLVDASKLARVQVPTYYVTYSVLCHATDELAGDNRDPFPSEVLACSKNVLSIANMIQPKFVVFIGKLAQKYWSKEFPYNTTIQNLIFLLHQGGKFSPWYQTNIQHLVGALKYLNSKG